MSTEHPSLPHSCSLLGEGKLLPAARSVPHHCPVTGYQPDNDPSYCDPSPPSILLALVPFLCPRIAVRTHVLLNITKPVIINMALPGL